MDPTQEQYLRQGYKNLQTATSEHKQIVNLLSRWQEAVAKYPDYRDGYFQLALLEYQLGNKNEANMYNMKALELDPNFKEGLSMENRLAKGK